MWRDAWTVAAKDLRIELRSRVGVNQVVPFAVLVLLLFAFALGPDRKALASAAAGLFWLAVLFSAVLAVQRSFAIESADGARDGLRLSGLDPAGIFLGKAAAVVVQLAALEVVVGAGVVVLYGAHMSGVGLVLGASALGTVGIAAAGMAYGAIASGLRVSETLLPLLLLPVVVPVLLAGTKTWDAALTGHLANGMPWLRLLALFAIVYSALGLLAFGPLLEAS